MPSVSGISMIIPSYRGRRLLSAMLPTIDLPFTQVLVVDQGGSDGTEELCRKLGVNVIQTNRQCTFTEAANIGMEHALSRGADYILLANNDIEFLTPVCRQLVGIAEAEKNVGAVAPTQLLLCSGNQHLAYRTTCNLSTLRIEHDYAPPNGRPLILESEFVENTCALFPRAALEKVGLLDDAFEFYHEDVDLGFRLSYAGFRSVYDQSAQILHKASSSVDEHMSEKKQQLLDRNKRRLLNNHVRGRLNFVESYDGEYPDCSWNIINKHLALYLRRYGLTGPEGPRMVMAHPGIKADYLCTVWETDKLPKRWIDAINGYGRVFVPSRWNAQVFEKYVPGKVSYLPFGVETDVFHPWGPRYDFESEFTFLTVCANQHRKALDVTIRAWLERAPRNADLVIYGTNIGPLPFVGPPTRSRAYKATRTFFYDDHNIRVIQPRGRVSSSEMAEFYRGADAFFLNSRSEGFGFPILEAMACGTLTIVPNYGGTADFIKGTNCLTISGTQVDADYADKGFTDVGRWWEPSLTSLVDAFAAARCMPTHDKHSMEEAARQFVASNFTWRHSALSLRPLLGATGDSAIADRRNRVSRQQGNVSEDARPEGLSIVERVVYRTLAAVGRVMVRAGTLTHRSAECLVEEGPRATFFRGGRKISRFVRSRLHRMGFSIAPPNTGAPPEDTTTIDLGDMMRSFHRHVRSGEKSTHIYRAD
ncbi:MAG: glycosyltransferase [Pseudomonadota bacterium]